MTAKEQKSVKETVSTPPQVVASPPALEMGPWAPTVAQRAIQPGPLLAQDVSRLQGTVGNKAVNRMLNRRQPGIQAKLTVGAAGDAYEQEADRVAAQVLRTDPPGSAASVRSGGRAIQSRPLAQRSSDGAEAQDLSESFSVGADFERRLETSRGDGQPLPDPVRNFMEPRFGADFSGVQVHTSPQSAELNRQIGARAFTQGNDIYLGAGQSLEDRSLLAHELTHTLQQGGGPSAGQPQRKPIQRWAEDRNPETDPDWDDLTPADVEFARHILSDMIGLYSETAKAVAKRVIEQSKGSQTAGPADAAPEPFEAAAAKWRAEWEGKAVPEALKPLQNPAPAGDEAPQAVHEESREDESRGLLPGGEYEKQRDRKREKQRKEGEQALEKASKPKHSFLGGLFNFGRKGKFHEFTDEDEAPREKALVQLGKKAKALKEGMTKKANQRFRSANSALHGGYTKMGSGYSRATWQDTESGLMDRQLGNWEHYGVDPEMAAEFMRRQYPHLDLYYQVASQANLGESAEGEGSSAAASDTAGGLYDAAVGQVQPTANAVAGVTAGAAGLSGVAAQNDGVAQGFGIFTGAISAPDSIVDAASAQVELERVEAQIREMTDQIGKPGAPAPSDDFLIRLGQLQQSKRAFEGARRKAGMGAAGSVQSVLGSAANLGALAAKADASGITGALGAAISAPKFVHEVRDLHHQRRDQKAAAAAAAAMGKGDGSAMSGVLEGALGRREGKLGLKIFDQSLSGANMVIGAAGAAIGIAALAGASVASAGIVPVALGAGAAAVGLGAYVGKLVQAKRRGLTHDRLHQALQELLTEDNPNFAAADRIAQQLLGSDPQVMAAVFAHQVVSTGGEARAQMLDFLRGMGVPEDALTPYEESGDRPEGAEAGEESGGDQGELYRAILGALKAN